MHGFSFQVAMKIGMPNTVGDGFSNRSDCGARRRGHRSQYASGVDTEIVRGVMGVAKSTGDAILPMVK